MKINIHTYFYGNNYGALLQSLFLKTYLKNQTSAIVEFNKYQPKKLLFREEFKPIIKKNLIHSFFSIKKFFKFRKWKNKYIETRPITKFIKNNNELDKISIYGSDEIWNFQNPFFGYDPFFFGQDNSAFKFSYAASFGSSATSKIDNNFSNELKKLFQDFKFLSVRDLSSRNFLKKLLDINVEIVLDPIFLIDNEFELFLEKKDRIISKKYCLIYGQFFSKEEKQTIIDFSKKNNLQLVSIGFHNNWVDVNLVDVNPSNFLNIFKYSSCVFTSMFHGVLFSVKYNKTFWFTDDPYRKNKLDYFLHTFKISNRIVNKNINFDDKINYIPINKELDKQKKISKNFIKNCIKSYLKNENQL